MISDHKNVEPRVPRPEEVILFGEIAGTTEERREVPAMILEGPLPRCADSPLTLKAFKFNHNMMTCRREIRPALDVAVVGVSGAASGLISDRVAAHACQVSARTVLWWVKTGAWPLPCAVDGLSIYFDASQVDAWVETGAWPIHSRFRWRRSPKIVRAGR